VMETDLAVGKGGVHPSEESIEEIFVPKPKRGRVSELAFCSNGGGDLVWVRKDSVRDRRVTLTDCFSVSKSHKFEGMSRKIQLTTHIWEGGSQPTYAEIVKRPPL
jgi:hypothetical protein